jgi:hypothetical protein
VSKKNTARREHARLTKRQERDDEAQMLQEQPRDNCQVCLGESGGVRGNENVMHGAVVCDYCTCRLLDGIGGADAVAAIEVKDMVSARALIWARRT